MKKNNISNLSKILTLREKVFLLFLLILSIIVMFIELLTLSSIPILFSQLINFEIDNKILDQLANKIAINPGNNFVLFLYIITVLFFLRSIFLYLVKILETVIFKRIRLRLSFILLGNFLNSNLAEIQKDTPATKIWKMEIVNNLALVIENILTLVKGLGLTLAIFAFLIIYAGSEIIYFFITLILFTVIFYLFFAKYIEKTGTLANLARKNKLNIIQNIMNGIKDIFILNKFNFFKNKFKKFIEESESNFQKNIIVTSIPIYFLEFIGILFICLFAMKLNNSGISSEKIISIISVLAYGGIRLIGTLKLSLVQINSYKTNSFITSVVLEELRKKNNVNYNCNIEYENSSNPTNLIEIRDLFFEYDDDKVLLKNVNYLFKQNKIYAILGESGSGKSTFLDLLLGFYKTNKNNIKINCPQESIGYVPQESYMSSGTIKENIAFGLDENEIDIVKINSCLKKARIFDFVNSLPNKVDSHLSIFGSNISVGQKQRIGIARALYSDPKIILLDEPTSALDENTERDFMKILQDLKKDRLIIMTTHKKTILEKFDIILNLQDKTLKE